MLKKTVLIIVISLFFIIIIPAKEKLKVAIINFSPKGVDKLLSEAVTENLITSVVDSGLFEVIERNQLDLVMNELKLQNSDDFNDNLRVKLGNIYGVQLIIIGSVTKIGDKFTINIRGVEVSTAISKFAKNLTTNKENEILFLIPMLVDIIKNKNPEEKINNKDIKISDSKINFNISNNQKKLLITGIILTSLGGTFFLSGGVLIGVSYYAAWYAVYDYLNTDNFKISDWGPVWQFVFAAFGYSSPTIAGLLLISGITLSVFSLVLIPGIIFLAFYSKNKTNISFDLSNRQLALVYKF